MLSDYLFEALIIIPHLSSRKKESCIGAYSFPVCVCKYHWRELPQVSFCRDRSLSQHKYVFVTTKHVFRREKNMIVATKIIMFVATNTCLSRQTFCLDKHTFVVKKDVATNILSRQAYFCREKRRVCCDKTFAATKMIPVAAPANDMQAGLASAGDRRTKETVRKRESCSSGI